ncbi:MAG: hypothetical protein Sv326_0064 [Candidatus Fermentimicrarchaeum limneticum]|uniref:DUF4430 domain-containing protein n=1 Tax=Fermentimicrarchaeum limneticum TaxID=2795018 RepID=A0A7D6BBK8_FERL1|nr:MAG: hypothetical protein Sv326_0064 [Candidatus Fermentimicrarchaeum limneticum]
MNYKLCLEGDALKKLLLMLLVLSGMVFAGRVGLVVQFDGSSVTKECVEFQNRATAFDILKSSGLGIATYQHPLWGVGLCRIGSVGCEPDNCFCKPEYWGFYYMVGGKWEYSPVGIGDYDVDDGDVLGFRWGNYGSTPEIHTFNDLCPSSASQNSMELPALRYFEIETRANCSGEPVLIEVKERGGGAIWEMTNFVSTHSGLNISLEYGVRVNVLLHQFYLGRDAGFEKAALPFTDEEGKASFIPKKSGVYRLEFDKYGFLGEEREVEVAECEKAVTESSRPVEVAGPGMRETGPNITRVEILAPPTSLVNSTVVVKMMSEEGKPLAYESIVVKSAGGEKQLITNESGEATFTAADEGVYSYSSPDHLLNSFVVTNIIKATTVSLETAEVPEHQEAGAAPSAAMAVANLSPTIIGVGAVIILALLYLLKEVRK